MAMRDIFNRSFAVVYAAALVCSCAVIISAAEEKASPGQSGDLKNIVIEGTPRIQMKGDKPSRVPDMDPKDDVEKFMWNYINDTNPTDRIVISFPLYLPAKLASDIVLSPWRGRLLQSPVLSLTVKSPPRVQVSYWRLVITDDRGRVFRTMKGKGNLPQSIEWDGISDDGEVLKIGRPYAYSLSVLDEVEVPTYLFGKSVVVNGYANRSAGKLMLHINTDNLFTKGPAFSQQGGMYIREVQDWLRKVINWRISVDIYGDDQDLAQREAELIKDHLEENLHLEKGSIAAKGHQTEKDLYQRTEITAVKS